MKDINNMSFDEIEAFYNAKEAKYIPLFAKQDKDLITFLVNQNDNDLDENATLVLFTRMCMNPKVRLTDETTQIGNRTIIKAIPR